MEQWMESIESRRLFSTALPAGFSDTLLPGTLKSPTATVQLPDGRLLVAEKAGTLRVFKNNSLLATPALTLTLDNSGDRGLLSVAADPKFADNHYIYLNYFRPGDGFGRVSRFTMSGDTVKSGSEKTLITLSPQVEPIHGAGGLQFGADGDLYISAGDNEIAGNSQSLATLHGKVLRIHADGTIPTDNPFYDTLDGDLRAIYALGFRNAFSMGADAVNGTIYVNDVGAKAFEEIDELKPGANYGWDQAEGDSDNPLFTNPIYEYPPPAVGVGVSVIGGAFYTGVTQQFPASYAGQYFFGDWVQGYVKTLDPATKTVTPFATDIGRVIDLDAGRDGTLFVTTYVDGRVHAIKYKNPTPPPPPPPTGNATFSGYVVNDANGNGKWDSGEKAIAGRTVWIDLDNDGKIDSNEATQVTDAAGRFSFTGLKAGTYKFREVLPTGWKQTSPANNYGINYTLTAGQTKSGMSFQVKKV